MLSSHSACNIVFKLPGVSFIQNTLRWFIIEGLFAGSRDVLQMGPASRISSGSMQHKISSEVKLTKNKSRYWDSRSSAVQLFWKCPPSCQICLNKQSPSNLHSVLLTLSESHRYHRNPALNSKRTFFRITFFFKKANCSLRVGPGVLQRLIHVEILRSSNSPQEKSGVRKKLTKDKYLESLFLANEVWVLMEHTPESRLDFVSSPKAQTFGLKQEVNGKPALAFYLQLRRRFKVTCSLNYFSPFVYFESLYSQ